MKSIRLAVWIAVTAACVFAQDHTTWSDYGGAADSAQYSALKQIDRSNVSRLQVAWTYPTGDGRKYFFNPLVVDGVMYVLAKNNSIVALDAASGKEIWTWTAGEEITVITHRGINYWESKDRKDRRLLFSANHYLRAIDARTGKPILSFGVNGRVNLKEGLGRDPASLKLVQSTTPGRVFEDLLILGSATNEGYTSGPGDIRAFDVRTGKVVWTFHTIPHPGEFGYDTWPKDAWKTVGGANVWGELTLDVKRGIVYAPTASPKYNFYGADRKGANLFGDCLLALDARTGQAAVAFPDGAPRYLGLRRRDRSQAADGAPRREDRWTWWRRWASRDSSGCSTGLPAQPLWPIEERPVPRSDMPREESLADAAVPGEAAAVRAAEIHGRRPESVSGCRGSRALPRPDPEFAQRGPVHAPEYPRHHADAGQQRRRQLGRGGGGSHQRQAVRGVQGHAVDAAAGARSGAERRGHRGRFGTRALRQRLQLHGGERTGSLRSSRRGRR